MFLWCKLLVQFTMLTASEKENTHCTSPVSSLNLPFVFLRAFLEPKLTNMPPLDYIAPGPKYKCCEPMIFARNVKICISQTFGRHLYCVEFYACIVNRDQHIRIIYAYLYVMMCWTFICLFVWATLGCLHNCI